MPRQARVVFPGLPHHITQRGVRRMQTFFLEEDYKLYFSLLQHYTKKEGVSVLAWCLMPNHVHLLLIPPAVDSLRAVLGPVHGMYAQSINEREHWSGHLWQSRFASYTLDDHHLIAAARYIELNPLRAKLVVDPAEYSWSSAKAHLLNQNDGLTDLDNAALVTNHWSELLASGISDDELQLLRKHEHTNRPLGSRQFMEGLETRFNLKLSPAKRGRPKKQ